MSEHEVSFYGTHCRKGFLYLIYEIITQDKFPACELRNHVDTRWLQVWIPPPIHFFLTPTKGLKNCSEQLKKIQYLGVESNLLVTPQELGYAAAA